MARGSTRSVKIVAATTGVMVAAVLAMPSLASAEGVDHDHAVEATTTTAAPATTKATTTTTKATTTTTARVPQLTEVGDVYAPGAHVTVSGTGCKVNGKPGTVVAALATQTQAGLLPETAAAKADGSYSITVTLPANVDSGRAAIVTGCTDGVAEPFVLDGLLFVIQRPGEPVGNGGQNTAALKGKAVAKIAAPKAVKASPKFTG